MSGTIPTMSDPETSSRMEHPEIRIADPFADDVNDRIAAAVAESPTGSVRVYMTDRHGLPDTDETADIVSIDENGNLVVTDPGTA